MNLIRNSNSLDFDRLLNDFWGRRSTLQRVPRNVVDTPLAPRVDVTGHDDRYELSWSYQASPKMMSPFPWKMDI